MNSNLYKNSRNGLTIRIDTLELTNEGYVIHYMYLHNHCQCTKLAKDFYMTYVPVYNVDINQDIIKLIESGYKFNSFSGSTLDGRTVHLDMES